MLGSVKRDGDRGTWLFVVDLPPGADGKRRQKKRRGFPTKKAAEAALAELVGRSQRGPIAEVGRQTLAAYLEGWLPGVRVSRTGSTAGNYRWVLEAYVLPRLGGIRLAALQPNHLRSLNADLLESGSLGRGRDRIGSGGPLSARTVSLVHRLLHRALQDAVADGLLPRNPGGGRQAPSDAQVGRREGVVRRPSSSFPQGSGRQPPGRPLAARAQHWPTTGRSSRPPLVRRRSRGRRPFHPGPTNH
jgi:hypothetical protein